MKISTNILEAAQKWLEKNWQQDQDYNISMNKVKDNKPPIWFAEFRDQQLIFNAKVDTFIEEQKVFNNKVDTFIEEQKVFNNKVDTFIEEQLIFNAKVLTFINEQQTFNGQIIDFMKKQLAFNELLLTLPTIKKELHDLKR